MPSRNVCIDVELDALNVFCADRSPVVSTALIALQKVLVPIKHHNMLHKFIYFIVIV